jgi:PAS domain S-box-containing protein
VPHTDREPSVGLSAWLDAAAAATNQGIVATDRDGRVTGWSAAATRILGYAESDMAGRLWRELLDDTQAAIENDVATRAADGESVQGVCETVRCADGSRCPVVLSVTPVRDTRGEVVGAVRVLALPADPDPEWRAASRRSSSRPTTRWSPKISTAPSRRGTAPPS